MKVELRHCPVADVLLRCEIGIGAASGYRYLT